jgi:acyl carrier protein phosphodiesterase
MNFLSHLYLSGDFDEVMIGNFMADFVKGKPAPAWGHSIIRGIELHRRIDTYTDSHPVFRQSKHRLQPSYHKYSGVIVDIFYDHFLAARWNDYSAVPLPEFAERTYRFMNQHLGSMPPAMEKVLWHMERGNWLLSYARLEGVEQALSGMARRTVFQSNMERAVHDLRRDYEAYQAEFRAYFPELITYVEQWKRENLGRG